MQLVGRVFVLAVCVLSAYSFPHIANTNLGTNEALFEMITAQVRTALLETHALSPAEVVCADFYNRQIQYVSGNLTAQTNACFETADRTTITNQAAANATANSVRADLLTVQRQLANCTNQADASLLLNCNTASYDSNMALLDRANSDSYLVIAQTAVSKTQVEYLCSACLSASSSGAKRNFTAITNDHNKCLENISKHRNELENFLIEN